MPLRLPFRRLAAFALLLIGLTGTPARAQDRLYAEAEAAYARMAYHEAIPLLGRWMDWSQRKGRGLDRRDDAHLMLAEALRFTGDHEGAVAAFGAALEGRTFSDSLPAAHALHYAQSLQTLGRHEEAMAWFTAYRDRMPQDARAARGLADGRRALSGEGGAPAVFTLEPAPWNSPAHEYGAVVHDGDLWFASSRPDGRRETDGWTGQAYLDLYRVGGWLGDSAAAAQALPEPLNGPWHDGPGQPVDGGEAFVYGRSFERRVGKGADRQRVLDLGLFRARRLVGESGDERWGEPFPERVPGLEHAAMHPTVSADGSLMVFAGRRPDGRGGYDLLWTRREGEGWSEARPLDPALNSPGDDLHPHLDRDGNLWFASDGRGGLGGLDLFVARRREGDWPAWETPRPLPAPINSAWDDFSLAWVTPDTLGIFASNRPGGQGGDDLYLAVRPLPVTLPGLVLAPDSLPFGEAEVLAVAGRDTFSLTTGADGRFSLALHTGTPVDIWARSPGYRQTHLGFTFRSPEAFRERPATLVLQPRATISLLGQAVQHTTGEAVGGGVVHVLRGTDTLQRLPIDGDGFFAGELPLGAEYVLEVERAGFLAEPLRVRTEGLQAGDEYAVLAELRRLAADMVVELNNIYYDYGKAEIRADAQADLERLRDLLADYPAMSIEIGAHTDARSSASFNQDLSQRRAEAARAWLVDRGVDGDRIRAVGHGESRPRNRCTEGVDCTEEEHQFNRRTEFRITYFDEVVTSQPRAFAPGTVASPWDKAAVRNAFEADSAEGEADRMADADGSGNPFAEGTAYGIQVGIDKKPGSRRFSGYAWLGEIHVEPSGRGFYRYVIGYVASREEAEQIRGVLREAGITDAFIVTYVDGVRQR